MQKILAFIIGLMLLSSSLLAEKKELLFYIGITMVKPVSELVKSFEQKHNCEIKILQGGSQDLYDSIKFSKKGDLYLPGSVSYRYKHIDDGLLLDGMFVGYNKASLVVQKGNPKKIPADLNVLANPNYRVVLGNVESGSIGNATKKILTKFGNYEDSMINAVFLAPDSRKLTEALKSDKSDVILNWYATTFWEDNKNHVEALVIDEKFAPKAKLVFNLLKTSKYPKLTKAFMDYASSKEGRAVFHKYGFLDKNDLENFDTVTF